MGVFDSGSKPLMGSLTSLSVLVLDVRSQKESKLIMSVDMLLVHSSTWGLM